MIIVNLCKEEDFPRTRTHLAHVPPFRTSVTQMSSQVVLLRSTYDLEKGADFRLTGLPVSLAPTLVRPWCDPPFPAIMSAAHHIATACTRDLPGRAVLAHVVLLPEGRRRQWVVGVV